MRIYCNKIYVSQMSTAYCRFEEDNGRPSEQRFILLSLMLIDIDYSRREIARCSGVLNLVQRQLPYVGNMIVDRC